MPNPQLPAPAPPQVAELLGQLLAYDIDIVLVGSVAAIAHGVDADPGDLDVAPSLTTLNLQRLGNMLRHIQAAPESLGKWVLDKDRQRRWKVESRDPHALGRWEPVVEDIETYDHLFHTAYGNFDVVPNLAGTFESLRPRSYNKAVHGHRIHVASIDDLLAHLTVPRRDKDAERVEALRMIQLMKNE